MISLVSTARKGSRQFDSDRPVTVLLAIASLSFPALLPPDAHGAAEVIKLNQPLAEHEVVFSDFAFSLDGARVVYRAGVSFPRFAELFVVSVTGGTPVRLNDEIPEGGESVFFTALVRNQGSGASDRLTAR